MTWTLSRFCVVVDGLAWDVLATGDGHHRGAFVHIDGLRLTADAPSLEGFVRDARVAMAQAGLLEEGWQPDWDALECVGEAA